ncbi:MAG: DUF87 domain-containing protein [Synergistaceae bacterium]|nr:DUF87 domain-containing protein [Synergistaceae bacterium]
MDKKLLLAQKEQEQMLPAFDDVLLFSLERRYLEMANVERLDMTTNPVYSAWDYRAHLRMMKVEEVSYEGKPNAGLHLLNMQNVLAAMKDDSQNVISVIRSTKEKTSLYYGLSKRVNIESDVSTHEYADILSQTLHGNFLGMKMHPMNSDEIFDEVIMPLTECTDIRAFPGIPSLRLKDPEGPYVQGIDRFIEGMRGEDYCLVTIAEPIPLPVVDAIIKNLFDLSSTIHSQVKATVQKMKGSSDTVNVGLFGMMGNTNAATTGIADTLGASASSTEGGASAIADAIAKTKGGGSSIADTISQTTGGGSSIADTFSQTQGGASSIADTFSQTQGGASSIADTVSQTRGGASTVTDGTSSTRGGAHTTGSGSSVGGGVGLLGIGVGGGKNWSSSDSSNWSSGTSHSRSASESWGNTTGQTQSTSQSWGNTTGQTQSTSQSWGNTTGQTQSTSQSWGNTIGQTRSTLQNWADTASHTLSTTRSWADTATRMGSFTRNVANTMGRMAGFGGQGGYAHGWNRSQAVTQEVLNKTAEYCEQLCDAYIKRLQAGKNLGLWNVGVYLLTSNRYTQLRAKGLLRAAFSGDETYWEPMRSLRLNHEAIAKYIMNFNNPKYDLFLYGEQKQDVQDTVTTIQKIKEYAMKIGAPLAKIFSRLSKDDDEAAKMLEEIRRCPGDYSREDIEKAWQTVTRAELGHPFGEIMGGVSTPLNTEELSIIMNVPRQEVQGITIREAAPFGVNYVPSADENNVRLGLVVHKRMPMDDIPYVIPQALFQKHAFVCGVTGSGKTNTCMTLLKNLNLPFLVVEPAKTEYRQMLNFMPDLQIFTLGSETESPFRINPFEFNRKGKLLTHIDSIKAVFNAAFPMYASMPYILEEAIIEIYRDKGWDLATTTNRYLDDLNSDDFYDYIPTLQDLYDKIEPIVKRKSYAQEQTMNIQAALMARLSSLLTGSKGLMFNTRRSTPLAVLLEHPVILELKNIGDDDEKCFIMGLILSSIYQYRENNGSIGSGLKHVLLIEEAHRLLRHTPEFVSPEIGNSRGKAVETFTNVISEIREYGQGVIIVDQIPSKLTPDVVKNTNIKIVHRTLAQDDRDYVGSTMNLSEAQERELCLLEVGRAVVHREGMDKAFLVQMDRQKGELKFITDEEVKAHMADFTKNTKAASRIYGLDKREGLAEAFDKEDFRRQSPNLLACAVSLLLGVMARECDVTEKSHEIFANVLQHDLGISDDLRCGCHALYNINALFAKLQDKYGGNYRECLRAQRLLIDAWFGEAVDIESLSKACAAFTNVEDGAEPWRGILRWYVGVDEFRHSNVNAVVRLAFVEPVDYSAIDGLMRDVLYKVMCGISLPQDAESSLLTILLDEILARAAGYYMKSVSRAYAEFLERKQEVR